MNKYKYVFAQLIEFLDNIAIRLTNRLESLWEAEALISIMLKYSIVPSFRSYLINT